MNGVNKKLKNMKDKIYMKFLKLLKIFSYALFVSIILFFTMMEISLMGSMITEKKAKKIIIENTANIDILTKNKDNFNIDIDHNYYEYVTIHDLSDSSYCVVFWGDRDSWKWDFIKDKDFCIDVKYNRYKGKNVDLDVKVLFTINKIKEYELQ